MKNGFFKTFKKNLGCFDCSTTSFQLISITGVMQDIFPKRSSQLYFTRSVNSPFCMMSNRYFLNGVPGNKGKINMQTLQNDPVSNLSKNQIISKLQVKNFITPLHKQCLIAGFLF